MKISKENIDRILPLALPVITLLVYLPTINHQFLLDWDDQWQVLNKYTSGGLGYENLQSIFGTFYFGQYSPLNQLFYSIIYNFFGFDPRAFHAVNLLWHIGNVCLVYVFIKMLFSFRKEQDTGKEIIIAFFVALLFAIHPIQAEVVSWISASKVLTCSFFFLLSMIFHLSYTKNGKLLYYLFSIIAFVFSFLCKELAVTLPLCLILIDFFIGKKTVNKDNIIEKIPYFSLMICFLVITILSYNRPVDVVLRSGYGYSFGERIIFGCYSLFEYIVKLTVPLNLKFVYPYPMEVGDPLPVLFYIYPIATGAICLLFYKKLKRPITFFCCAFFLINLSFFLHVVPLPRFAITADRYLYLPSIGLFLLAVFMLIDFLKQILIPLKPSLTKTAALLFATYCIFLGIYSHHRSEVWFNDQSLRGKIDQEMNQNKPDGKEVKMEK
jgi:hypothetical protein